jgi:hypothetical protein
MLLYDTTSLNYNEAIIDTTAAKLLLYTHETGTLVLMATLDHPRGKVFFTTDEILLDLFCRDKIYLQSLFEATASNMATILEEDEFKLYMRMDADIRLRGGKHLFSQLRKNNTDQACQMCMDTTK